MDGARRRSGSHRVDQHHRVAVRERIEQRQGLALVLERRNAARAQAARDHEPGGVVAAVVVTDADHRGADVSSGRP